MSKKQKLDKHVEELLGQMTLKEKVSLLAGKDIWNTMPIPRLGIPSIVMTDGPHGVRAANAEVGRVVGPTTAFPTGISMSASWNTELVEKVGEALGEETRAMDCDILLGPCVNIVRFPLGGRNFETYSEDPFLAGKLGIAYVDGVQSRGVGTSLKHYAVNNYEIERFRASSRIDERTLREIYLPHFEMVVKESQPWTVMCAYNRINGVYASQHDYLLNKILKDEWGFEGLVVSDWGANHTIFESIQNGLDLEMPGPTRYYHLINDAVANWQIDEEAVNKAVRRILRIIIKSGRMDGTTLTGSVNTPEHQEVARKLAEEAVTLLKNEGGVLPLTEKLETVAIIGPNAAEAVIAGGGSSHVDPPYRVTPLAAIRQRLGDKVELIYEQGCDNLDAPMTVPPSWLSGPDGEVGLRGTFYATEDFSGEPQFVQGGYTHEFWWHAGWIGKQPPASLRFEGRLTVPETGSYRLHLGHTGKIRIKLDGKEVLASDAPLPTPSFHDYAEAEHVLKLKSGKTYKLQLDFVRYEAQEVIAYRLGMARTFAPGADHRLANAVSIAKNADVAVVFVGYPEGYETEGTDRPDMLLTSKQNELISAVAKTNPKTVVVVNAGAPIAMPWIDDVAAVLLAYYPGLEGGNALAKALTGEVNPSGKLPITLPKRLEDSPAFINSSYPGCREVNYGEGIFIGYRYFDKVNVEPLFPFGYGLSYTTFEYSNLETSKKVKRGKDVKVSVTITNTGNVAGKEVVQLYVHDPISSLPRPVRELKGFAKVELEPGESKEVSFKLDERAFSFYDPIKAKWVAEAGDYEIQVGSSSRDIRLKKTINLAE